MAVPLKSFDPRFKVAQTLAEKTRKRIDLESANPTVWTKDQLDDLRDFVNSLINLMNAVSEMAHQVRND